ncbi:MAG: hypothetical protein ABJ013_06895 [Halioglobus sp.]
MRLRLSKWQGVLAATSLVLLGVSSWTQSDVERGGLVSGILDYSTKEPELSESQQTETRAQID